MIKKISLFLLAAGILLLAAYFRLTGVDWDQGQHLHPDERFLTMVSTGISWPKNLKEYLDQATSPLNPQNRGFGFFVYGLFPITLTKWVAEGLGKGDYGNLTLVGRQLSALFDLGTVLLVFLIARVMSCDLLGFNRGKKIRKKLGLLRILMYRLGACLHPGVMINPLITMFLYAIMVLPIQLSHFYAVDTYLTFFITLAFYFLVLIMHRGDNRGEKRWKIIPLSILLGVSFGLALASKITAAFFAPTIGLGLIYYLIKSRKFFSFLLLGFLFSISCYLSFRLTHPYLFNTSNLSDFSLNQKVLENWKQLKSFDDPTGGFPPAVQWITTKPYLFPLKNMILWGLGLPLGIIALSAIGYRLYVVGYVLWKKKFHLQLTTYNLQLNLILLWVLALFIYQGMQFVKALRYFFPIYPFLAILSGWFIYQSCLFMRGKIKSFALRWFFAICCLLFLIIYPISFVSIYQRANSRVAASEWIINNVPSGSTISAEEWDDGLPLSLPGYPPPNYKGIQFPLYWPDVEEKWQKMDSFLRQVDYIFLTSNRLYGSTMTYPQKYPVTIRYYNALFDGSLGFEKVAEFTSRPNLPMPFLNVCLTPPFIHYGIVSQKTQECPLQGISFVDDYADETFTVYDHPKVVIFKKVRPVEYFQVLYKQP